MDNEDPSYTTDLSDEHEAVVVPETGIPISPESYEELTANVDPLSDSEFHGVDIYLQTLKFIEACLALDA